MKVALFIPCYIDQFYPHVGMATVSVLEHFGVQVEFPEAQTCCGQPMANSGCMDEARPLAEKFVNTFDGYEYVVAPSGSCVSMVRNHYDHLCDHHDERSATVRRRTLELSEFLTTVLKVSSVPGRFPHQVGLHQSCHGLRELRLGEIYLYAKVFEHRHRCHPHVRIELIDVTRDEQRDFHSIRSEAMAG